MLLGKKPNILLLLAVLTYGVRWIGIRLMGSEQMLRATPVQLALLALLLLIAIRAEKKTVFWMGGVFVAATLAAWAISGNSITPVPLVAGGYQAIFLTGICSLVSVSPLPLWQKLTGAVLLSLLLAWLPGTLSVPLGYNPGNMPLLSGKWSLYWGGVAVLAVVSWTALRLRPVHFAIALLLMEIVFLALLRL